MFSIHWNPDTGSKDSEGMDWTARASRERSFLLLCPLYRLPTEGVVQIKGGSSHFKRFGLKFYHLLPQRSVLERGLPTPNDFMKKKYLTCVSDHLGFS